jgi:PAS domain S-box-containing protein
MQVLLVDDEPMLLEIGKLFLERREGIRVQTAASAREGLGYLEQGGFDIVVSDYQMPEMDGIEFLKQVKDRGDNTPFIIFTGKGREEVVIEALNSGADFYVQKGGDPTAQFTDLTHKIRQAVCRREMEKRLEDERNRLEQVTEHLGACLMIIDTHYRVVWTNKVSREVFGEMDGELCYRARQGRNDVCPECGIGRIFKGEIERAMFERVFTGKSGETYHFEAIATPLRDEAGAVYAVLEVAVPITDLKEAEAALKASEKEKQIILDSVAENITFQDRDLRILWANRAAAESIAMKPEDLVGRYCYELWHGRDSPCPECPVKTAMKTRTPQRGEMTTPDGRMWLVGGHPVLDAAGEVQGAVETTLNITDRRKASEALEESERRFRTLVESAEDAVLIIDRDGRITYINPYGAHLLGREQASIAGRHLEEIFPPEVDEQAREMLNNVFDSGKIARFPLFYAAINRWFDVTFVPLQREGTRVTTLFCITRDITEHKHLEQSFAQANSKLQLLSGITRHDILNQITGLLAYVTLIKESAPDDPERMRYLDLIEQLTHRIESQISFTKDYEDMGVKEPGWQNVRETVERAGESLELGAIDLSVETGALDIFADPMLEKVFFNLISNSVQHGCEVTRIRVSSMERKGGGAMIVVEDDGVGIPGGMKEDIFRKGVGKHKGYGLFLAREILSITGISIRECGREGRGARFELEIPVEMARAGSGGGGRGTALPDRAEMEPRDLRPPRRGG